MSDSSNKINSPQAEFNALEYLKDFCANTKVVIADYTEISSQPGWSEPITRFINKVKNYHIRVEEISDYYSVLDIKFSVIKTNREVAVWRAVSEARNLSRFICASCGIEII